MKREKTISTRHIKIYRMVVLLLFSMVVLFYSYYYGFRSDHWVMWSMGMVYIGILIYHLPRIVKELRLIKQISYDDQNLYVHEPGGDVVIPLERIRDVEIVSLDGMYKFYLMDRGDFGPYILCKTSIWYPLNFPRVDKELNHVRYLIARKKRTLYSNQSNQLTSSTP